MVPGGLLWEKQLQHKSLEQIYFPYNSQRGWREEDKVLLGGNDGHDLISMVLLKVLIRKGTPCNEGQLLAQIECFGR